VEVQHRELAVEIAVGRQWRTKNRMRRKMRKRMRRKSRTALIKSNTPHLAGGVHPSGIFLLILIHVLLENVLNMLILSESARLLGKEIVMRRQGITTASLPTRK
jgi:ribosomal protein L32E